MGAGVGLAATGVGLGLFELWSGLVQADLVREQGNIQREVKELNAKSLEADAAEAEKFGFTQSSRFQSVIDNTISDQRVGFAAQDIDFTFGSAKDIIEETKTVGFLNQIDIKRNARARALGLRLQASNIRAGGTSAFVQAALDARSIEASSIIGAVRTGASGFARS